MVFRNYWTVVVPVKNDIYLLPSTRRQKVNVHATGVRDVN